MQPVLTQPKLEALLGRSLTTTEANNLALYLDIALARLQDLLCTTLTLPLDNELALLLARCFNAYSQETKSDAMFGVTNKKVEDFSISYDTDGETPMQKFARLNANLIAKYDQCRAKIKNGDVRRGDCIRCI